MKRIFSLWVLATVLTLNFPALLRAEDAVEKAAIGIGRTVGNAVFIPVRLLTVLWGAAAGVISYPLSAGNAELTNEIWRNTAEGPYVITPEIARMAIGERPELEQRPLQYR